MCVSLCIYCVIIEVNILGKLRICLERMKTGQQSNKSNMAVTADFSWHGILTRYKTVAI
jgi:hypothetical protein